MTAATSRQACPVCDTELTPSATQCPTCHTDLRLFAPTSETALDFYNDGLDLARVGDREGAIDKMRGALATDPGLVDAYIVLGKLLAQSGQATDLDQAIIWWERARGHRPSGEQARKLDRCIATADASVRSGKRHAVTRDRGGRWALIAGVVILAAVCGGAGYVFRGSRATRTGTAKGRIAAESRNGPSIAPVNSTGPPADPAAAVGEALHRPDITVARIGDRLALRGTVQSESEKGITLAAAAYAARTPPSLIDSSELKVKPPPTRVEAGRVEHMLRLFVDGLDRSSEDPLRSANLSVSGGANQDPLKVTGTCVSVKARDEVTQLVKAVYPSANPIDPSGLTVRTIVERGTAPAPRIATSGRRRRAKTPVVRRHVTRRSAVAAARPAVEQISGAKLPGDQVYINLSTKTYTVQPGDTFFGISRKYNQSVSQWHKLWETNRQAVHNPQSVPAGTVLKLPSGWKSPDKATDENP